MRAARRRQAQDALEFERDRAEMLATELEDVLAGADGRRVDADVFAQMSADDVQLVRAAIGNESAAVDRVNRDDLEPLVDSDAVRRELEEEISRLEGELASSRRLQDGLERYLAVLSDRDTAR